MPLETLKVDLCRAFCATIDVRAVPMGFAVSTVFQDRSGDPITFFVVADGDDLRIEDDGDYLASLVSRDIPINEGQRAILLDAILGDSSAYWDRDTFEIRSAPFPEAELPARALQFVSALVRVRDLELLTRDIVRSTFREDAGRELVKRFGRVADIYQGEPLSKDLSDYPVDFVVRPRAEHTKAAAVYLVNSDNKLNEALLLHMELAQQEVKGAVVIGLIEEPDLRLLSKRKFQRTQNKLLPMPIFKGDERSAMDMIAAQMGLPRGYNSVH